MDYTKGKDYTTMIQQMTGAYKSTMDNSIDAMTVIQANTEKMVRVSLDQSPWFPEEAKKFVNDWLKTYKKGYDDLKEVADVQYRNLEAFVNLQQKADPSEKPKKAS